MNAAVAHRGPDGEGAWVGENFAFGMRRLSIIDLSGGHQPMWDRRTGLGIVYNGEVYNYKVVRADLEKAGIDFQTTRDNEVVLKSLALRGTSAVHAWNGMFAVAAWNDRTKRLLLEWAWPTLICKFDITLRLRLIIQQTVATSRPYHDRTKSLPSTW